jgi:hypothetical protein
MKIILLSYCIAFLLGNALLKADILLQPNDRVAIDGGDFSLYLEDYILACQPIPGLDVSGNPTPGFKPTVVLVDSWGDVATFEKGQTDMVESLKKAGVRTIVIGSSPCVDSVGFQNDPVKAAAENKNRAALAAIAKSVAAKEGVVYADVYGTTLAAMLKAKKIYGDKFALDTNEAFNLAIASAFLKALGYDGNIGTLTVDFGSGHADGSAGQKIISFKDNTLIVESTRVPFGFPGHGVGATDPPPWPVLKCLTFPHDLNRYILIVKNLPTAQTKIYWGDNNQDFSSDELAKGIDLEEIMPGFGNPFGVFSNIDNGVRIQEGTEQQLATLAAQGKPDPQADAKREAAYQVAVARFVPPQTKTIIQPLAPIAKQPPGPIPVILDTDLDGDVDDVGALALLNDFMDQGECKLLACVHNTINADQTSCATIQAINTWYGHPSIPIGQSYGEKGPADMTSKLTPAPPDGYHTVNVSGSSYTKIVRQKFDPNFPDDNKMPAGVDIYRKALASAADRSVVICSVGTMENIQDLIQSQPDLVSDLSGLDLVRKKVRELVIMANTQPADHYLLSKWPTKIT